MTWSYPITNSKCILDTEVMYVLALSVSSMLQCTYIYVMSEMQTDGGKLNDNSESETDELRC